MTARPKRQRKHDRITWGSQTTKEEIAVDHAIAPFDRRSRELDRLWGVDRLPEIVSPETAARFGRTLGSLNAAIDAQDSERAADRAAACIRGLDAMDAEARASGLLPLKPPVEVLEVDGRTIGVMLDDRMWQKAVETYPGIRLVTLRELVVLAGDRLDNPIVEAIKDAFPGAEVRKVTPERQPEDPIPF